MDNKKEYSMAEQDDLIFKAIEQFKLDINDGEIHAIFELLHRVEPKTLKNYLSVNVYN